MDDGRAPAPGPKGSPPRPAPSPHASPSVPAPPSPVAERQVPANRAPQAPQHRVQLRRLRPLRPVAGRERTAGEVPSRLQPAPLLRRSGKKRGFSAEGAGRPWSLPPRPGSLTAAPGSAMTAPSRAARLAALPWRPGGGKRARPAGSAVSRPPRRSPPPPSPPANRRRPPPGGGGRSPSVPPGGCAGGRISAVPEVKKSRRGGERLFAQRGRPSRRGLARNGNPGGLRRPGVKGPR